MKLDLEAVAQLDKDTQIAFLTVDFRVLHRHLMHTSLECTVQVAEQARIKLINKLIRRFHCKACKLAKSKKIIS